MSSAPRVIHLPFSAKRLDRRAVSIVSQLRQAGHETYLVGGCVRDLLLDLSPKDFDIATDASSVMPLHMAAACWSSIPSRGF